MMCFIWPQILEAMQFLAIGYHQSFRNAGNFESKRKHWILYSAPISVDIYLGLWVEHAHLQLAVLTMAVGLTEVYQARLDAKDQVIERFGTGNQVEGSRQGTTLVKVGQPQLGSSKLPLYISVLLQRQTVAWMSEGQRKDGGLWFQVGRA